MISAFYRYYLLGIIFVLFVAGIYYFHAPPSNRLITSTHSNSPLTVTQETDTALGFPSALDQPANNTTLTGALAATRSAPKGSKTYRNEHYRFELFYPDDLSVSERDEGNNATTVTFEKDSGEGFQVFIVPYGQRQVSSERFKLDEPSGIIKQPTDVLIDNVRGTMFFGANPIMGDTREVWFIRGGYLFEVTSYRELDAWLSQIMATWRFL